VTEHPQSHLNETGLAFYLRDNEILTANPPVFLDQGIARICSLPHHHSRKYRYHMPLEEVGQDQLTFLMNNSANKRLNTTGALILKVKNREFYYFSLISKM
jgi:hypothetical protein